MSYYANFQNPVTGIQCRATYAFGRVTFARTESAAENPDTDPKEAAQTDAQTDEWVKTHNAANRTFRSVASAEDYIQRVTDGQASGLEKYHR